MLIFAGFWEGRKYQNGYLVDVDQGGVVKFGRLLRIRSCCSLHLFKGPCFVFEDEFCFIVYVI